MQDEVNEKTIALYIKTGKLTAQTLAKCPQCGEYKLPHQVCGNCGYYKGKEIVKKEA